MQDYSLFFDNVNNIYANKSLLQDFLKGEKGEIIEKLVNERKTISEKEMLNILKNKLCLFNRSIEKSVLALLMLDTNNISNKITEALLEHEEIATSYEVIHRVLQDKNINVLKKNIDKFYGINFFSKDINEIQNDNKMFICGHIINNFKDIASKKLNTYFIECFKHCDLDNKTRVNIFNMFIDKIMKSL